MNRLPTLESFGSDDKELSLDQMKSDLKPVTDWLGKNGFALDSKYGANVNTDKKREASSAWTKDDIRVFVFRGQMYNGGKLKTYFEASIKNKSGNKYYHHIDLGSSYDTSDALLKVLKRHVPLALGSEEVLMESNTSESETIRDLEIQKMKLFSKALKMMPNSPSQMAVRKEIEEIDSKLDMLKSKH